MGRHRKEPRPCSNPACDKIIPTRKYCPRCQKRKQRGRLNEGRGEGQLRRIQPRPVAVQQIVYHTTPKFPSDMIDGEKGLQQRVLEKIGQNAIELLSILDHNHPVHHAITKHINSSDFITTFQNIDAIPQEWSPVKTQLAHPLPDSLFSQLES